MTGQITRQQRRAMERQATEADQAIEGDRRFFVRHPLRNYRVRLLSQAERAQMEAFQGGTFNLTPEAPIAFLALKQLAPGTRLKVVVFGPAFAIGEELTEAEARSVYEGYADLHPHVREREAMMLAAMRRPGGPLHAKGSA